jgi:hypothetical protein
MNWIHFFLWVSGIYLLYYLVVIALDVAGAGRAPAAQSLTNELTFSEEVHTQKLEHQPEETAVPASGSAVIASGGVVIQELFSLVRKELVVYKKAVSY